MPVPLAELSSVESIIAWTSAGVTAGIGAWALWRSARNKTNAELQANRIELEAARRKSAAESDQVERQMRQEAKEEEIQSLRDLVDFLTKRVSKLTEAYGVLQASITEKLIIANEEHHKCREETAVVKEQLKWTREQLEETKERLARAEVRIKELEDRSDP